MNLSHETDEVQTDAGDSSPATEFDTAAKIAFDAYHRKASIRVVIDRINRIAGKQPNTGAQQYKGQKS